MQLKGFLKRVLPFFLTFSLGLLIASFFVTIAAPSFNFKNRRHKCREYKENYRLRSEIENLRQDNDSLRRQLAEQDIKSGYRVKPAFESDLVPPPPPMPPAPRAVR